ncbi:MAG: EAL domain-containing protein, partial [Paenarthrobacter sp.]
LDQALKQLAAWDSLGHQLRVSVNIHPATLLEPQCPAWVASALDRHEVAPHRLVLELLEDYVADHQSRQWAFDELLALGVRIAQDDLGAGHSNIRRLTALAFDTVKIDHRVTAQIHTSPIPTLTFLAAMTTMGENMGWHVVAEGLEDAGITEAATLTGIPYGQGYDIARPMPAEQVLGWISESTASGRQGRVQTFPGALAFHWQFARLTSPHPGPLENCPLTSFLATNEPAGNAMEWHRQQHATTPNQSLTAAKLLQWLTQKVTQQVPTAHPAGSSPGSGAAGHQQEFFVLPLDQ